jgi:hypothetical protein
MKTLLQSAEPLEIVLTLTQQSNTHVVLHSTTELGKEVFAETKKPGIRN